MPQDFCSVCCLMMNSLTQTLQYHWIFGYRFCPQATCIEGLDYHNLAGRAGPQGSSQHSTNMSHRTRPSKFSTSKMNITKWIFFKWRKKDGLPGSPMHLPKENQADTEWNSGSFFTSNRFNSNRQTFEKHQLGVWLLKRIPALRKSINSWTHLNT